MSNNYEMIATEPISNVEAQEVISTKEDKGELTYREERIKEYLKDYVRLSKDDFLSAKEEIKGLEISRLDEDLMIKILDILPKSGTELRSIVTHSGTVLVDESVTQILDILNKYRK